MLTNSRPQQLHATHMYMPEPAHATTSFAQRETAVKAKKAQEARVEASLDILKQERETEAAIVEANDF